MKTPLYPPLLIALLLVSACAEDNIRTPPTGVGVGATTDTLEPDEDVLAPLPDTLPLAELPPSPEDTGGEQDGAPPIQDIPAPPEEVTEEVSEPMEDTTPLPEVAEDAGPADDAEVTEDIAEPPAPDIVDEPEPEPEQASCITPDDGAWSQTGAEYCATLGLFCTWVEYHDGGGEPCTEPDPYTGCWSSSPLSCCLTAMSGHAGSPEGASALWHCGDTCPEGSALIDGGCVDIDECALPDPVCGLNATCTNTVGSYQCLCDEGYTGDGQDCELANPYYPECITSGDETWSLTGEAYCASFDLQCTGVDYFGSDDGCGGDPYSGCWSATTLSCCKTPMSGHAGFPDPASATWYCGKDCPDGSELIDGTCIDIDECALPDPVCGQNATCTNQVGSYKCECDLGYTGDGQTCEPVQDTPACITSGDASWSLSGNAYCQGFGMTCTGTAYYGSSPSCEGDPYTGCWGGDAASCCGSPMSGHAGSPEGASALWTCAP